MGKLLVKYISPSKFFYWERCPLKAVYTKMYYGHEIFPVHPNADLGTIIHKFYENKKAWKIDSAAAFERKWKELIEEVNHRYVNDHLQKRYYPLQWYTNYYAVKKAYLKENILTERKQAISSKKGIYEKWINDDVVGGMVDLTILRGDGNIDAIIDFKTGHIFEKKDGKRQIKEVYGLQMALYAAVIEKQQGFLPQLFIENMQGQRFSVTVSNAYIDEAYQRAVKLKQRIDEAQNSDTTNKLAVVNFENCRHCSFRVKCTAYKNTLINHPNEKMIDLKGQVLTIQKEAIQFEANKTTYEIRNIRWIEDIQTKKEVYIYNLFFPDSGENVLYGLKNTIFEYEEAS